MEIELDERGLDIAIANLEAIAPALAADVIGRGLRAAAQVVARTARMNVPVVTGALQRSIRAASASSLVMTAGGQRKVSGTAAVVQAGNRRGITGAAHAVLVEYGTVRTPAQPFLEPAVMGTISAQLQAAASRSAQAYARLASQLSAPADAPAKLLPSARVRRLAAL